MQKTGGNLDEDKIRFSACFDVIFVVILGGEKIDLVSCKTSLLVHFETTREPQNILTMRSVKRGLGDPALEQFMLVR